MGSYYGSQTMKQRIAKKVFAIDILRALSEEEMAISPCKSSFWGCSCDWQRLDTNKLNIDSRYYQCKVCFDRKVEQVTTRSGWEMVNEFWLQGKEWNFLPDPPKNLCIS